MFESWKTAGHLNPRVMVDSQLFVYDFSIPMDAISQEDLREWLKEHCKKWAFQGERGETSGYEHWQGRLSLREKKRKHELISMLPCAGMHVDRTSAACRTKISFYVTKERTRISGPWTDKDIVQYIPRDIRGIELRPWQQTIVDWGAEYEQRKVRCIVDKRGNIGKTIVCRYAGVHDLGRTLPFCNNYKDIMRMAYCLPTSTMYMVDMPRAINKDNLNQIYSAIETLKSGYCWDDRYTFKEKYIDPPQVVVFTNMDPDMRMLSLDRWDLLRVNLETMALEPYVPGPSPTEESPAEGGF